MQGLRCASHLYSFNPWRELHWCLNIVKLQGVNIFFLATTKYRVYRNQLDILALLDLLSIVLSNNLKFFLAPLWPLLKTVYFGFSFSYTPQNIELEYKLRPFIPDFIPAVGDIDAFLKVGRPDGATDGLGLHVLDEPCATQSEPAVLCLQLRASTKQSSAKALVHHSPCP